MVALAVIGTALAQIILYRVLARQEPPAWPRHLSAAGDGALLRRAPSSASPSTSAGAGRARADPRRRRARLWGRRASCAASRSRRLAVSVTDRQRRRSRATPTSWSNCSRTRGSSRSSRRSGRATARASSPRSSAGRRRARGVRPLRDRGSDGQPAGRWASRSRTAARGSRDLGSLAVHPDFRGQRLADEAGAALPAAPVFDLGFHRLQLEIYGFNERAMRHAERAASSRKASAGRPTTGRGVGHGAIYRPCAEDWSSADLAAGPPRTRCRRRRDRVRGPLDRCSALPELFGHFHTISRISWW